MQRSIKVTSVKQNRVPFNTTQVVVTGVVDGNDVTAIGDVSRIAGAKSPAHKERYLERLLLGAAPTPAEVLDTHAHNRVVNTSAATAPGVVKQWFDLRPWALRNWRVLAAIALVVSLILILQQ